MKNLLRWLSRSFLTAILLATIVGLVVAYYKDNNLKMRLKYPYVTQADPSIGISCKALVGSDMYGTDVIEKDKGIHATLFKGTDVVAVEVDEEGNFKFITKASIDIGDANTSENWVIQKNDSQYLIATLANFEEAPIANYVDVFFLNKENGTAVWSKSKASFFGSTTPLAQSYLMECH